MSKVTNQLERRYFGPDKAEITIFYAHGAGAGNEHEFNLYFCKRLSDMGFRVVSFNFPYMQKMYTENKRRPPDKLPKLKAHFLAEVSLEESQNREFKTAIFMGKSMGGRVASILAAEGNVEKLKALVVLGYPFMPSGNITKLESRTAHFTDLRIPTLIIQGERDTFGTKSFFDNNHNMIKSLTDKAQFAWLNDGDHSFKPRKRSGTTEHENYDVALRQIEQFIQGSLLD